MKVSVSGLVAMALICNISMAQARTMGHYAPGVVSIRDLAVPPVPGFFYAQYNAYYEADRYVDGDGNKRLDFESEGGEVELETDVDVLAIAPVFLWSTGKTILGANYAFYVAPNFGKSSVAAKLSVLDQVGKTDDDAIGMGDTFVQPVGWGGRVIAMTLPWVQERTFPPVNTMPKTATALDWGSGQASSRVQLIGIWMRRAHPRSSLR